MTTGLPRTIDVAPEVEQALGRHGAVVALESAVVSHGLPHEHACRLVRRLDEVVRAGGAIPALVAVRDGRVKVGADPGDIAFLFHASAIKVAERDLAVAVASSRSGGTTVAATLAVAARVGIRVMATGGIGGVHIGAEQSGDVSADLYALSRVPAVVVCAGAKAICDPVKTVEALDTLGVAVVGYRTDTMPAFYARSSGVPVPHRVETPDEVATIARAKADLGVRSAILVVQPVPDHAALDGPTVAAAVAEALARARASGVRGGALTPYLLAAIADVTEGRALTTNLSLLEANAALAAQVAVALARTPGAARR